MIYGNIAIVFLNKNENDSALIYNFKCLNTFLDVFDLNSFYIGRVYLLLGQNYENLFEYDKALEYYFKSLDILIKLTIGNNDAVVIYRMIGAVYYEKYCFL